MVSLREPEQRRHAAEYLTGLLSNLARKTGEGIAYFLDQDRQPLQLQFSNLSDRRPGSTTPCLHSPLMMSNHHRGIHHEPFRLVASPPEHVHRPRLHAWSTACATTVSYDVEDEVAFLPEPLGIGAPGLSGPRSRALGPSHVSGDDSPCTRSTTVLP